MTGGPPGSPSISFGIIEALAEVEGTNPTELGYTLHDYIDTDAIDSLNVGGSEEWYLRVKVADHTVTVDSDGFITVDGTEYSLERDATER